MRKPPTAEELRGQLVKQGFDSLNDGRLELAEAQFNLAQMYLTGDGVRQNKRKAVTLLTDAANGRVDAAS